MALIETINSLKQQGYTDADIASMLQDQGISPREINESMSQSKIKQAVGDQGSFSQEPNEEMESEMQPSIADQRNTQQQDYEQQTPYPDIPIPSPSTSQQLIPSYSQEYQGQENIYPPQEGENYSYGPEAGYDQYPQQYAPDTSMITEIASQLISEKFTKTEKALTELAEFKSLLNAKVEKVDERLKKIESIIDQLQMSLIRKSSAQEENVEDIKSEMKMMQSSFGKIINPLTDRAREVMPRRRTKHQKVKKSRAKLNKSKVKAKKIKSKSVITEKTITKVRKIK